MSSEETPVRAGQRHLERQEYVMAFKAYTRAVKAEPANAEAVLGKVAAMRALRRPRGALRACEDALVMLPECQPLLAARQELVVELGDDEAAEVIDDAAAAQQGKGPADAVIWETASVGTTTSVGTATHDSPNVSDGEQDGCPATKSQARSQRESAKMSLKKSMALEASLDSMGSEASQAFRMARKEELLVFYRDFYGQTRSQSVDTSQYSKAEKQGLSIQGGHRHMPRPEHVDLPEQYRQPVGTLTPEQLAAHGCDNERLLISVHGDLFDVSDRPDKYGPDGPYYSMAGHDITWALWSGYDDESEWDKYFDLHKAQPKEERDRRFQGLMSWWAFYEQEYGSPVGRLSSYEKEWELETPPVVQDLCCIM